MDCTKDQPGYYTDMLDALADLENVKPTKVIRFENLEKARKAKFKLPEMTFIINGKEFKCLGSTIRIGSIRVLLFDGFEIPFDEYNGSVSVQVRKQLSEYKNRPKNAGSYKYCEGGGWYSMASLFELNGKYYTNAY